ncbi:MAG TPA: aminotransferase class V-fold PLP-dependent enzyme [Actinomycetota bacterium]
MPAERADAQSDQSSGGFDWHPEPTLLRFTSADEAREPLEELGRATWGAALDYLFDEAMRRSIGTGSYPEVRRQYFGPSLQPGPAPSGGVRFEEVLAEFRTRIAPFMLNSHNPRSLPYFTPPALPVAVAGETLAQWTNQGVDIWSCSPVGSFVEEEVIRWLCDLVGYGEGSFGVLTSGGVMANLMAMTVARDVHLPGLLGIDGTPRGRDLEGVRVYASDQTHFSIRRGLDVLGFPRETIHVVESDAAYRLRGDALRAAVDADLAAGLRPFAVSAVTGSTNTGSIDPVGEIAEVARRNGMWLHVDAAYGGAVRLSSSHRHLVEGLEVADSVTLDPHKWFFQPHDIGGLLVRERDHLIRTFHASPEYYRSGPVEEEPLNWYAYSLEGTRRFRALKLWCSWKFLGTEGFGRLIEHTLGLARHLVARIDESDDLEAEPADPELSVVCFRHLVDGMDDEALDRHQDDLQRALERSGEGWVSTTRLRGRTYLRAGIVNYLTTTDDVDAVLTTLRRLAAALDAT